MGPVQPDAGSFLERKQKMKVQNLIAAAGIGLAMLGFTVPVTAQSPSFEGQTIEIYVGTGAGSTYDNYARILAEYMPKHLPGKPTMIVKNQPGAGGARATSYLYNVAPKDGTALGMVQQNLPLFQVLSPNHAQFDMGKMNWIGVLTDISSVVAVSGATGVNDIAGARAKEFAMGTTGRGSETFQIPTLMNELLGTKFKLITGYKSVSDMDVAIERGELHGRGGSLLSWTSRKPDWIRDGKIKFIVQIGLAKDKDLPDSVPLLIDLAADAQIRKMLELVSSAGAVGRSLVAPPGVPADRVAALRAAFDATVADPAFIAATAKRNMPINPTSGAKLQKIVADTVSAPPEAAQRLRTLLGFDK
jgi:tripartite-type tricarboxylate transporter receptor subunit TctC